MSTVLPKQDVGLSISLLRERAVDQLVRASRLNDEGRRLLRESAAAEARADSYLAVVTILERGKAL